MLIQRSIIINGGSVTPSPPSFPTTDLVAYYRLDEGTGTNLADQVGSNDGSRISAVWTTSGKNNDCLSFGNEKYATLPHVADVTSFTSSFSISLWVYPTDVAGEQFMLQKGLFPYNYRIDFPNSKFNFAGGINGSWNTTLSTSTYALNTWYHVVAVYDSTSGVGKKLYVNGSVVATNTLTGTLTTSTNDVMVGKYSVSSGYDYSGKLDEFAFWDRPLTSTEVGVIYNSGSGIFY